MMRKLRRTLAVAAIAAGATAGISALQIGAHAAAAPPALGVVTVTNEGGVVHVGTGVPGQPLVGATIDTNTGRVCVGFSLQVPQCANLELGTASAAVPSPVWVDADASDGRVGVGVLIAPGTPVAGVSYNATSGQACAGIGMQRPVCAQLA